MAIKVYQKRGNLDYKEKRLVSQIQEALTKKFQENPALESSFSPATTKDQLQQLHNMYCAEEVSFTEINSAAKPSETMEPNKEPKSDSPTPDSNTNQNDFVDPFNREEPITRDYVMEEGLKKNDGSTDNPSAQTQNTFSEPVTFDDSFKLPDDESSSQSQPKTNQTQTRQVKSQSPSSSTSTNNNSGGDEDSRKRKRRKRFAKNVITAVCAVLEKGFTWYGTKNINEAKLAEYEITGELDKEDLATIVSLTDGQDATVREFFKQRCITISKDAKISKEQKEDLIDTFHEVLVEKNMVPTPMQDFLMAWGEVVAKQGLDMIVSVAQTNSILDQLKERKKNTENVEHEEMKDEPARKEPEAAAAENKEEAPVEQKEETPQTTELTKQLDSIIETKE